MKIALKSASLIATMFLIGSIQPAFSEGLIRSVLDTAGNAVSDTAHLAGTAVKGTFNATGDLLDASGQIIGRAAGSTFTAGQVITGTVNDQGEILGADGVLLGTYIPVATTTKIVEREVIPIASAIGRQEIVPVRGYSVGDPSVDARRQELSFRIASFENQGMISPQAAADYQARIAQLTAEQDSMIGAKGFLDDYQARCLFKKYDRLGIFVDAHKHLARGCGY